MPLPDDVVRRLIQARLLLDRDRDLAMTNLVAGPTHPPDGSHPDHADLLEVAGGFILGVVRVADRPRLFGWDPFAALGLDHERPPGSWSVVGDVHDVDLLVLNEDDGSVWLVDGEPGGHWPDGTPYRRLADSLAGFLREHVFGPGYRELTEILDDDWADIASRLDELQPLVEYVRFEGTEPTRRRTRPDAMALAKGLAHSGRLTPEDRAWWGSHENLMNDASATPGNPPIDRTQHPDAQSFIRADAAHLLDLTRGCLDLLDRNDVGWREVRTYDPGRILYADAVQVVAEPRTRTR